MFGSYGAIYLWENYSHVFIDQLFDEKAKINEHLDKEQNEEKSNAEKVREQLPETQQDFLYKLRKEICIYHDQWEILENVYGETKDDYTEEEIQEIKDRQERRYQKEQEAENQKLKEAKPAPSSVNDNNEDNEMELLSEDELDADIEKEFGEREDMLQIEAGFIEEDKKLWEEIHSNETSLNEENTENEEE